MRPELPPTPGGVPPRAGESGASLLQLVLVLGVLALLAWLLLRPIERTADTGAEVPGPPDMVSSLDHTRQARTLSDMEQLARANDLRRAETGRWAESLADLAPVGQRLDLDAWGRPYLYEVSGASYRLVSLGADGARGPAPPEPSGAWSGPPYAPDLVLVDGRFVQSPRR